MRNLFDKVFYVGFSVDVSVDFSSWAGSGWLGCSVCVGCGSGSVGAGGGGGFSSVIGGVSSTGRCGSSVGGVSGAVCVCSVSV